MRSVRGLGLSNNTYFKANHLLQSYGMFHFYYGNNYVCLLGTVTQSTSSHASKWNICYQVISHRSFSCLLSYGSVTFLHILCFLSFNLHEGAKKALNLQASKIFSSPCGLPTQITHLYLPQLMGYFYDLVQQNII